MLSSVRKEKDTPRVDRLLKLLVEGIEVVVFVKGMLIGTLLRGPRQ